MFWLYIVLGIVAGAAIGSLFRKLQLPGGSAGGASCGCGCGGAHEVPPATENTAQVVPGQQPAAPQEGGCPFCHPLILGALLGGVGGAMIAGLVGKGMTQQLRTTMEATMPHEDIVAPAAVAPAATASSAGQTLPAKAPVAGKPAAAKKDLPKLTAAEFDQKTAKGIVVVDFYADWCGPCKIQKPILEEYAAEVGDQARFYSLNIDEQREIALRYGVQAVPTLAFFKDGKLLGGRFGLQEKADLRRAFEQVKASQPEAPADKEKPSAAPAPKTK